MDPALPTGGLQRIFQQYDNIKSHSTRDDGPAPWEEEDVVGVSNPTTPAPKVGMSNRPTPDDGRVTVEKTPTQQVLTDATRERPKGRPKSWGQDAEMNKREAIGQERMQFAIDHPNRGTFAQDEQGLNMAYHDVNHPTDYDPENEGTYYDPSTRTMYVRGSVTKRDWQDDFTKIPAWGDSRKIEMYQNAKKTYDRLISQGKPVDRISGHSLGGSVALQLQKDKDIPFSRTFGAPIVDLNPFQKNVDRFRHPLDPFSALDRAATNIKTLDINTHSFGGYSNNLSVSGKFLGM